MVSHHQNKSSTMHGDGMPVNCNEFLSQSATACLPMPQRFLARYLTEKLLAPAIVTWHAVYILDTGIRTTHDDFRGRMGDGASAVGDSMEDDNGHGTHVAGAHMPPPQLQPSQHALVWVADAIQLTAVTQHWLAACGRCTHPMGQQHTLVLLHVKHCCCPSTSLEGLLCQLYVPPSSS
jgi:hypothetical protein